MHHKHEPILCGLSNVCDHLLHINTRLDWDFLRTWRRSSMFMSFSLSVRGFLYEEPAGGRTVVLSLVVLAVLCWTFVFRARRKVNEVNVIFSSRARRVIIDFNRTTPATVSNTSNFCTVPGRIVNDRHRKFPFLVTPALP
jgi:hypothetical protein